MMAGTVNLEIAQQVKEWIERTAAQMDIAVHIYADGASQEGAWLSVPVAIKQPGDAYEHAVLLQRIEDKWNDNDHNNLKIALVPARAEQPPNGNAIARLNDLTARQQQILNRLAEEGANSIDAERFQAIRQEWEETMREVNSLFPSLA